jgi:RHS repeat-associated protein
MAQEKKTDDVEAQGSSFAPPSISLPKGGGAIQGIGEKFAANPVTGTGSLSIPIAVSPGRSGFSPKLSLSYDSGSGNGPFGFGWNLSLPSITRQTSKGLPLYDDAGESDVFILSGSEDLVPVLSEDGNRFKDDSTVPDYIIHRYRPRLEGLFARIERWTNKSTGEIHWRSVTKDNITSLYGVSSQSRIADPDNPRRVFSWLICQSHDSKGNIIVYEYISENDDKLDLSPANERNRRRSANLYLKRIKYGNRVSHFLQPDPALHQWLFEVVFDYGEGHYHERTPDPEKRIFVQANLNVPEGTRGPERKDPFSSFRSGFEVRTYRLCRRILMFHHFQDELGVPDYLVRATQFGFRETPVASFITSVTQSGFLLQEDGTYLKRSLPPLEFEYTKASIDKTIREVPTESLENLPIGLDGTIYRWVDLDGEGISGVLTEQAGSWFYKPNLGEGLFGPLEEVISVPSLAVLSGGQQQLLDLAGDGQLDLAIFSDPTPGFYERTGNEGWEPFKSFLRLPNINFSDPNLRFVDLNGDGHADILITHENVFVWYPSLADEGFDEARQIYKELDEENGPRLVFADSTQSIYLADISGDGLNDLVRIRNGDISYWPNLGYGGFGKKISMDQAPWFDHIDLFSQQRIRVADIDGSGTSDIIYLGSEGVRLYFNQSGNRWSDPVLVEGFPHIDNLSTVMTADLLGNGTACLVWSSPLPAETHRPFRYIDLMGGQKPHLLIKTVNNLGAETHISYAPSTKFYLDDKRAGKPWITKIPFPVHVVERVETYDRISDNRFVTRYVYHHGYFDGKEREFRGFGMVEQYDTEVMAALTADGVLPVGVNIDYVSHVPPVLTKTWFHSGAYLGRDHISNFYAGLIDEYDIGEYYREPGLTDHQAMKRLLPDTVLPGSLTSEEEREACRALKGSVLRREIYALDNTEKEQHPFTVLEQNYTVRRLQPHGDNRHAVFFSHPRETIDYHYERNPDDPRVSHAMTLEVNDYGDVLKQVAIGYGRRAPATAPELTDDDKDIQSRLLITYTENTFTNAIEDAVRHSNHYRAPQPAESKTYEITGCIPGNDADRFGFDEWSVDGSDLAGSATLIPYEQTADGITRQKRLIEHTRALYRKDDLTALLPLGTVEPLALPGDDYKLAFTSGFISHVFTRRQPGQPNEFLLPNPGPILTGKGEAQGGYVEWEGKWWISSGRIFYSSGANIADPSLTAAAELSSAYQHFFQPRKFIDPFGQSTLVNNDLHDLLFLSTKDAVGNSVTAENNYRILKPCKITDANRNRTAAFFDAMGMVTATVVMGKAGENKGDLLEGFDADPLPADLLAFAADPASQVQVLLGKASTRIVYDLERYQRAGQPPFAATLARETHYHDPLPPGGLKISMSFSYSDGFGREMQKKIQAEPGEAPRRQAPVPLLDGDIRPGDLEHDAQGKPVQALTSHRWIGTGRIVYNNKGKPVKQYEPFFSTTHLYEPEADMTDTGFSPVLFYDPVERVVATLHPNHTYEKVVFDPWRQITHDVNDTSVAKGDETGDPRSDLDISDYVEAYFETQPADWQTWHASRIDNQLGAAERDAARKTGQHANTPSAVYLDTLGRPFLTVAHDRYERNGVITEEQIATRIQLDIEGNQREVRDERKKPGGAKEQRIVMLYGYDMLGNRIFQESMEAGQRWTLNDVAGNPIRAWDSRRFSRRMTYDQLRRPTGLYVTENGQERLGERTVYGEGQGDADNHRTRVFKISDGAGVLTNVAYDFKGNLLENRRDLLTNYKSEVNWMTEPTADYGSFTSFTTYDALNRPLTATSPDGSIYRPTFNEANLLEKVDIKLRGAVAATPFVTNIDYDAKGQRKEIIYGNGARTTYDYDQLTYRLVHLRTTRPNNPDSVGSQLFEDVLVVQDLKYTYDPIGNITQIKDAALKTITHNGQSVEPVAKYTYDALYRLIEAHGREHIKQNGFDFVPANGNRREYPFVGNHAHPNDLQALRRYIQRYEYDKVGNFEVMRHVADNGGWTRKYDYEEESLIEGGKKNNRLTRTTVGNGLNQIENYAYDIHGNMTTMMHLAAMVWDFEDQLRQVDLGGGGTAYYIYDLEGQRARKVIESQNGARKSERIYLGGFEIYREFNGNGVDINLERESLHVMDDKQRIAMVETKTKDKGNLINDPLPLLRYQLNNHLGSAAVELDKNGALISYEEYHPYGTTAFQAGRTAAEISLKRYRYTGKERDEETGFNYHGARYYASWLARWISVDPIGLLDGLNVYFYARLNPINLTDKNGMQNEKPLWCVPNDSYSYESKWSDDDKSQLPMEESIIDNSDRYPIMNSRETGDGACDMNGPYDCEDNYRWDETPSSEYDQNVTIDPSSGLSPLRQQVGYRFLGTSLTRIAYVKKVALIPNEVTKMKKSISLKYAAEKAVTKRRLVEKLARQNLPAAESSISAQRNIKKYGDPLGPKNLEEARKIRPGKPRRSFSQVIESSGRTSKAFTFMSRLLGVLTAAAIMLDALRMAKQYEKGYLDLWPFRIIINSKKLRHLPDGTMVYDLREGWRTVYGGRFVNAI